MPKISALILDTAVTLDDLIITVNDPGGTPANRKVRVGDLFSNIQPTSNLILTQNSVAVFTSINAGAVVNTLYLTGGNVGIGIVPESKFHLFGINASFVIGHNVDNPINNELGLRILPYTSDGNVYVDAKTTLGRSLIFRIGEGAETGAARSWMVVDATNGNIGVGTPIPDGQLSQGLPNGQQISYKSLTELTTIAAAANTNTAIQIPANVIVKAVSVRVTAAIPTAATFTVTGATSGTTFNTAAVSTAINTTNKGNLNCPFNNGAAQSIRITPNLTPADNSGRVRVTIWFEDSIPATS